MKAVVYEKFGGPEVLQVRQMDTPEPGPDQVLCDVAAAGVNPFDWKLRRGYFASFFDFAFPVVTGMDFAGTVTEVGANVTRFAVGDRVFGMNLLVPMKHGSYAEKTIASEAVLARLPDALSFTEGAALPMPTLTAAQAVRGLEAGQVCLIQAGAGGVGAVAIQLARRAGAKVYTTASVANHDRVRQLGADVVIDYRAEDFSKAIDEPLDLIVDSVGGDTLARSYDLLAPQGKLVSLVEPPDASRYEGRMFGTSPDGTQLQDLALLFADGTLQVAPIETRSLDEAAAAQSDCEAGRVHGKLVLSV